MCHQILGGKILQILLGGKTVVRACVRASECGTWASPLASPEGFMVTTCMHELWRTNNIQ